MCELKTLKDISDECKYQEDCCSHCLKQEAIKWIKELELTKNKYPRGLKIDNYELIEGDRYEGENDDIEPVQMFLKHFFNITEEDLQ